MENDLLFQRAEDAKEEARKLVAEREKIRKAREQLRRVRRFDQPLLWFSNDGE